jgi:hypothetical protein
MNTVFATEAFNSDDAIKYLDRARKDSIRSPEIRHRAARLLTEHIWPDNMGSQPANWVTWYIRNSKELAARKRIGEYSPPRSERGELREGYHLGGNWWPSPIELASASQGECPECGFTGEFWDWSAVDAGRASEPSHTCVCGWDAESDQLAIQS